MAELHAGRVGPGFDPSTATTAVTAAEAAALALAWADGRRSCINLRQPFEAATESERLAQLAEVDRMDAARAQGWAAAAQALAAVEALR